MNCKTKMKERKPEDDDYGQEMGYVGGRKARMKDRYRDQSGIKLQQSKTKQSCQLAGDWSTSRVGMEMHRPKEQR